ncbi:MAG TPA: hypothetical protein VJT31_40835 [Rugosimonospora sp.]|nr:hypothetical protein [Rugosimonospora sp.]
MSTDVGSDAGTEVDRARRPRLDSEQGLLLMVGLLVLLGAMAVVAVSGW